MCITLFKNQHFIGGNLATLQCSCGVFPQHGNTAGGGPGVRDTKRRTKNGKENITKCNCCSVRAQLDQIFQRGTNVSRTILKTYSFKFKNDMQCARNLEKNILPNRLRCLDFQCARSPTYIDGETTKPRVLSVVFKNFRSHFIFLKENKSVSFFDVLSEFAWYREEKSRTFFRMDVQQFFIKKIKYERKSATSQTNVTDFVVSPLILSLDVERDNFLNQCPVSMQNRNERTPIRDKERFFH